MTKRNLTITKTREYLWRTFHFNTGAHLNWVTCWHVLDADTGEVVFGGHMSGNNTQSGCAEVPRKRDAQAFIDGYNDAADGKEREGRQYVCDASGKRFPGGTWPEAGDSYTHGRYVYHREQGRKDAAKLALNGK